MDNVYRRDHEMPYIADDAVTSQQKETKKAIREYNETMPFELEKGMECLERAGIKHKENVYFEPPFYCEYGNHIEVGENFYANTHCVMLDVGKITIGNNVLFGPNVGIYTAGHPIHPESRNSAFVRDSCHHRGQCVDRRKLLCPSRSKDWKQRCDWCGKRGYKGYSRQRMCRWKSLPRDS